MAQNIEDDYLHWLEVLSDCNFNRINPRQEVKTSSVFGVHMNHEMSGGFPLLTSKKVNFKAIVHELLWFISGSTNIKYLNDNGVHIWDEWADEKGNLGPVYGLQWRGFVGREHTHCDQIKDLIASLQYSPYSRRHIVSAWSPLDAQMVKLPPCHILQQYYVEEKEGKKYLSLQVYQRSGDIFLGVPFNIASYALLLMMVAQCVDMVPDKLMFCFGDLHLYENHQEQAEKQLEQPKNARQLPSVILNPAITDIDKFRFDDFSLVNYQHGPIIPAPISV